MSPFDQREEGLQAKSAFSRCQGCCPACEKSS
jgi:hypothetical protein